MKPVSYCLAETTSCPAGYIKCPRSFCIPPRLICDGEKHCQDGVDEVNCGKCKFPDSKGYNHRFSKKYSLQCIINVFRIKRQKCPCHTISQKRDAKLKYFIM
jgi:hypothetical protein